MIQQVATNVVIYFQVKWRWEWVEEHWREEDCEMFLEENNDEEEGVLLAERQIRGVSRLTGMLNTFVLK